LNDKARRRGPTKRDFFLLVAPDEDNARDDDDDDQNDDERKVFREWSCCAEMFVVIGVFVRRNNARVRSIEENVCVDC
tara:strand:+ start:393 stop:626 length:234 start_codon:yes stop_codon:yes gene_type:complete